MRVKAIAWLVRAIAFAINYCTACKDVNAPVLLVKYFNSQPIANQNKRCPIVRMLKANRSLFRHIRIIDRKLTATLITHNDWVASPGTKFAWVAR